MKIKVKDYFTKWDNWLVLLFLFLTVYYGIFSKLPFINFLKGDENEVWKNWENASVAFTILYTVILYSKGFFIKEKTSRKTTFEGLKIKHIGVIILAFLVIICIIIFQLSPRVRGIISPILINDRSFFMALLFLMALFFSIIDYLIARGEYAISKMYSKCFWYSDLPVTLAFGTLFAYSLYIHNNATMAPFFAGAVAFQMILSNLLWSLLDDNLFE